MRRSFFPVRASPLKMIVTITENPDITLGILVGRVVVLVHTPRHEETRIISMRKANEREQKIYQKRLGKT